MTYGETFFQNPLRDFAERFFSPCLLSYLLFYLPFIILFELKKKKSYSTVIFLRSCLCNRCSFRLTRPLSVFSLCIVSLLHQIPSLPVQCLVWMTSPGLNAASQPGISSSMQICSPKGHIHVTVLGCHLDLSGILTIFLVLLASGKICSCLEQQINEKRYLEDKDHICAKTIKLC